jgi:hypothetical protein
MHPSGPQTFRCCHCYCKARQSDTANDRYSEPRVGPVYADLEGAPFVDYYCNGCAADLSAHAS